MLSFWTLSMSMDVAIGRVAANFSVMAFCVLRSFSEAMYFSTTVLTFSCPSFFSLQW